MFEALTQGSVRENAIQLRPGDLSAAQFLSTRCPHQSGVRKVAANETLWCEGEERSHI
jgi:hypothetical protein